MNELQRLKELLLEMEGVLIGYSGGVDSTLLARVASDVLGKNAVCVLIESCLMPEIEITEALASAEEMGLNLIRLKVDALSTPNVPENPADRCYYCKKALFSQMVEIAKEHGIKYVLDGSNADDTSDYRPGSKAINELGIRSPLKELDITKEEVRALSRQLKLKTWNKSSYACLASRVPYGTPLTAEVLKQIENAETVLRNLGFKQFRVRHHGDVARIELMPTDMEKIIEMENRRFVVREFKALGYAYVALDLAGYRMGSMNEVL